MTDTDMRELVSRNYPTVMRVCRSWLPTYEDAEDAAQEVFVKFLESPREFSSREHEQAYFIRCAKSRAADLLRKRSRERLRTLPLSDINEPASHTDFAEDGALIKALASLPPYTRMLLRLHYGEGFEYRELARILRTTEGRLKMLVYRAKVKLRSELEDRKDEI